VTDLLAGAAVLGAVLTGLIKLVHDFIDGDTKTRIKIGACFVVSVVVVLLISASDFASRTVILGKHLDSLNLASQLVIALLATGIAVTIWTTLGQIGNIGENKVDKQTVATSK
jgi:hypothetical protein